MRHITRTHGVNTAWLHERVEQGTLRAVYIKSEEQAADIFTKAFGSVPTFERVRALIQIVSPTSRLNESVIPSCPSFAGGSCENADLPISHLQDLVRIRPECNTHGFADYWVCVDDALVRVHVVPRTRPYSPVQLCKRYSRVEPYKHRVGKSKWLGYSVFRPADQTGGSQ